MQSELATEGALAIEVAGGRPSNRVPFPFQITGSSGELALHGGAVRGFQSGALRLSLNGEPQKLNEGELSSMPEAAMNVAGVYAALRDDINSDANTVPDFEHAIHLQRLIDDLLASAKEGVRKPASGWPFQ